MYLPQLEVVNRNDFSGEAQRVIAYIQGESEVEEVNAGAPSLSYCSGLMFDLWVSGCL
jgi:hypothetical protein